MQNLLKTLGEVLKEDKRCVVEGELNKAKIEELGLELDAELLKCLMGQDSLKKHFFTQVGDVLVFDKIKFQKFINNKSFLPDSYTTFKNRIGLTNSAGHFVSESKHAVLSWPHKDCVLEGGQDKEDAKRNEVFFNEILAPDEIDHLLEPKALTKFKKYNKDGEHKVSAITFEDNLMIKGNNLLALHSLEKSYAEKIKLIYIDPPYNTEGDSFRYNDTFEHSTWLTFIKNRLEASKRLLSKDGFIFIQADDNEHAYLKVLMDEVFGRDNFLACIGYERSGVSGLGQGGSFITNTHEFILAYSKDKRLLSVNDVFDQEELDHDVMKRYNKILVSEGEKELFDTFTAPSTGEEVKIFKHSNEKIQTISLKDFKKRKPEILEEYVKNFENVYRNTSVQAENEFQNRILSICKDGFYSAEYLVSRGKQKGQRITAYYINGQVFAWLKDTAFKTKDSVFKSNKISQFWTHKAIPKADLANEGGVHLKRGKKPENLLKRIIELTTNEGDFVLDFFAGSGTTHAVAHKMKRKWIALEQLNYIEELTKTRLLNVINGDTTGISKSVNWNGGGSFVYCELAKSNQIFVEKITNAKKDKDLEALWDEIKEKGFISYKVSISDFDSAKSDFSELEFDDKKKFLIEVLDKNMLYVNLFEIEDEDHGVSEDDIKVNRYFYSLEKQQSAFEE